MISNVDYPDLVERANRLIEKHSLAVPRFLASHFINYHFWANVFTTIFKIKCSVSIRDAGEQLQMIRSCLNTLETIIEVPLDHIEPNKLLGFDSITIKHMLELAEYWSENFDFLIDRNNNPSPVAYDSLDSEVARSDTSTRTNTSTNSGVNTKAHELAYTLYKALNNQILAIEIGKKIKMYLGDFSTQENLIRASRTSIVRTRAIQPFDAFRSLSARARPNPILSVDLERYFPEVSPEMIAEIRQRERVLLLLERNVRLRQMEQIMDRINAVLADVVDAQRSFTESVLKEALEKDKTGGGQHRARLLKVRLASKERAQRAKVHKEINEFCKEATAAFLKTRSCLEQILKMEFGKIDTHHRQTLKEIRKYLRNHHDGQLEKVRLLLENIDRL